MRPAQQGLPFILDEVVFLDTPNGDMNAEVSEKRNFPEVLHFVSH